TPAALAEALRALKISGVFSSSDDSSPPSDPHQVEPPPREKRRSKVVPPALPHAPVPAGPAENTLDKWAAAVAIDPASSKGRRMPRRSRRPLVWLGAAAVLAIIATLIYLVYGPGDRTGQRGKEGNQVAQAVPGGSSPSRDANNRPGKDTGKAAVPASPRTPVAP